MRITYLLMAFAALAGSGCNTVALVDNVDLELDFNPLDGPSDALHSPYVQGSSMDIWVRNSDGRVNPTRWTIESSDPSVFSVQNPYHKDETFYVLGKALKAGDADLIVRDDGGEVVHVRPIQVRLPDRVEMLAHGILLIGRSDAEALVGEARIRSTGTGTYLARYWLGNDRLSGNGALAVASTTDVKASVVRTFLFEDKDWLQLTPNRTGTTSVTLNVGGTPVSALPVVSVADSEIVRVRILGEDESGARKEQPLVALALAYDALDRAVYGVEYKWQRNGASEFGLGDLYRYLYEPNRPAEITARFGSMMAAAGIHGNGFVDSSNRLGCQYGGPMPAEPPLAMLGLIVALVLIRWRRAVVDQRHASLARRRVPLSIDR